MTCRMAEKMPLRVHVKGKRKAPSPPANNRKCDNKTNGANDASPNARHTHTSSAASSTATPMNVAFRPSCDSSTANRNEMNNLSAVSSRMHAKLPTMATNLNIFDANATPTNAEKELNLSGFDVNANQIPAAANRLDAVALPNRHNDVWICTNCTLQNPFWKIVCDACERIKPYNTPNVRPINGFRANDTAVATMERKNFVVSVQIRPKLVRPIVAKAQQRNSMLPGLQYHVPAQCRASDTELVASKRNSVCASDMPKDRHELEVEKERIRLLIRSLNNRALATPARSANVVRANHRFWPSAAAKGGKKATNMCQMANAKQQQQQHLATSTNQLQSFNARNELNFAVPLAGKPKHTNQPHVTESGEQIDVLIQINKKLDRPNKGDKYYACADDLKRAIDSARCDRAHRQRPADVFDESNGPTARPNGSLGNNDENKMSLNVFINFNKAIQVSVPHAITLKRFKCHITKLASPCERPKIYFNGLQLQTDDQTLANYGISGGSSIYVNTERVIAHTKSSPKAIAPKSISVQSPTTAAAHNAANRTEQTRARHTEPNRPAIDLNIPTKCAAALPTEPQPIQLNRLELDKRHPKNENITLTKYRGVYNYNPRCNPNLADARDEEVRGGRPATASNQSPAPMPEPTRAQPPLLAMALTSAAGHRSTSAPSDEDVNPSIAANVSQYIELLSLDDSMDLTRNTEPFECPICLTDYKSLEGIVLRNCLHTFCMECARSSIVHSDEAEVRCPYSDPDYSCDCVLQDREIKGVLSRPEYDDHLAKSLRIAEYQIENSFHCRTPNCKGWCIYEDDVNTFKCPICRLVNCLTCRVIHDGLDCKQYQTMMANNVDNNPENVRTAAMLEEMVRNGEAMHCPACRVILMKKWGCDWLKCSMCKTEICWVTRGHRWGPAGKGDTSAGCRCGVDGFRCHPKCNYCH